MTNPFFLNIPKGRQTFAYYIAFFSFGIIAATLGPVLPFLAEHAGASISEASALFIAGALGFFLGSNIAGQLYDRVKGNPVIAAALALSGTAYFLLPVSNSLIHIFILLVFNGIGAGLVVVGSNTLLVWVRSDNLGPWMSGMFLLNGVGAFLSPLIITLSVSLTGNIVFSYRFSAFIFFLAAVFVLLTPSPEIRKKHNKNLKYTGKVVVTIGLTTAAALLYVGSEVSFSGWIFSYTREILDSGNRTAGIMTSLFWGSVTAGRLISIPLSRKMAPEKILIADIIGSLSGISIILLFPSSVISISFGTMIFGISIASFFPNLLAFTENNIGITGRINGIIFTGTALGGMSLPFLSGQLFQKFSPQMVMVGLLVYISINFILISVNIGLQNRQDN